MNTPPKPSTPRKVALITGASKRLGRATACFLHQHGYNIIVHYNQSKNEAETLCQELNQLVDSSAISVQADLTHTSELIQLVQLAAGQWQGLDLLVNNASTFYPTLVESASLQQWDDLFSSNAKAPFFLSKEAAPFLHKNKGSIVNMIDIHANTPLPSHTIYCMAKSALAMMTRSLAVELAPAIRVNGVAPGAIMWPTEGESELSEQKKIAIVKNIPLQRTGTELDIARTILFLADSHYITGQIIAVDGGRSLKQDRVSAY